MGQASWLWPVCLRQRSTLVVSICKCAAAFCTTDVAGRLSSVQAIQKAFGAGGPEHSRRRPCLGHGAGGLAPALVVDYPAAALRLWRSVRREWTAHEHSDESSPERTLTGLLVSGSALARGTTRPHEGSDAAGASPGHLSGSSGACRSAAGRLSTPRYAVFVWSL